SPRQRQFSLDRPHTTPFLIIYFTLRCRQAMVIFMAARKIEYYRDALPRVVEMIAAIEEALGVVRVVVFVIEGEFEVRVINLFAQIAEVRAHHPRTDDVKLVRPGQVLIGRVVVAL